jgi:hypothetical protein
MLESLLFILLTLIGGLFLLISLIVITFGLAKKSRKLKKIGLGIGIVPLFCFGIIAYYYLIAVPSLNNSQMEEFSGTYLLANSAQQLLKMNGFSENPKLTLNPDGTYQFDSIPGLGLGKRGLWKTGGIDGQFEFHDENGSLMEWGMPNGGGNNCGLSFDYENDKTEFSGMEQIHFTIEK